LFLRFKNILKKLRNFFLFKLIFFMFLYYFDVMRLTINFNFFSIIDFFSYGKEEINWWEFFYILQSWMMIIFFIWGWVEFSY
jgi:hypothetical protein